CADPLTWRRRTDSRRARHVSGADESTGAKGRRRTELRAAKQRPDAAACDLRHIGRRESSETGQRRRRGGRGAGRLRLNGHRIEADKLQSLCRELLPDLADRLLGTGLDWELLLPRAALDGRREAHQRRSLTTGPAEPGGSSSPVIVVWK